MTEISKANGIDTSLWVKLMHIQNEIVCPKKRYNKFGDFYYRSADDILESVKPLLKKYNACLVLADEVKALGEGAGAEGTRYYVRSQALFICNKTGANASSYGWARETLNKKKMDDGQITGSASSYARKYALCGLFGIDDSNDLDAMPQTPATDTATTGKAKVQDARQQSNTAHKEAMKNNYSLLFKKLINANKINPQTLKIIGQTFLGMTEYPDTDVVAQECWYNFALAVITAGDINTVKSLKEQAPDDRSILEISKWVLQELQLRLKRPEYGDNQNTAAK